MDVFTKESLINGSPAQIECLTIAGQVYTILRGLATVVRLEDEWYEDVQDPDVVIAALKDSRLRADIFTFWQRLPYTEPQFDFHREWESIAALPVNSFDDWWNKQIRDKTRNLIRNSQRKGVEVREARYDEDFVRGMVQVFNETPVRQGRRYWHYGKDFDTVKRQFSTYLSREQLFGAYYRDELIGFVMLGNAQRYALLGQIIAKIQHRDKSTNNALVAKAVEACAKDRLPYLVYYYWSDGALTDFKRHNGFKETKLPRYLVPLTRRGRLILRLGLHRAWKERLPAPVKERLKYFRHRWLRFRHHGK